MPRLDYVMKGIKRVQATSGRSSRVRLPITPAILIKLKNVWTESAGDLGTKLIWAACCLCFFAFPRVGKMTIPDAQSYDPGAHLCYADVAIDNTRNPKLLRIRIKQSKTDPFQRGIHLFVGRTGSELCPVAALQDYTQCRGASPGLLFKFSSGQYLCGNRERGPAQDECRPPEILRAQFSYRRRHNGNRKGCGRQCYQDTRQVGERGVPAVCAFA